MDVTIVTIVTHQVVQVPAIQLEAVQGRVKQSNGPGGGPNIFMVWMKESDGVQHMVNSTYLLITFCYLEGNRG